jgi:hypothetical protein
MLANPMSIVPLVFAALDDGDDAPGACVVAVEELLPLPQAATPRTDTATTIPTAATRLVLIYQSPFVRPLVEAMTSPSKHRGHSA